VCEHRPSRFDHGHVDRKVIGDGLVEGLAEHEGGRVGDLELHGDHRRDALAHECLCHAPEQVVPGTPGTLTRIENDQPK